MKNSQHTISVILAFLFIFTCSIDKNPVEPESGIFIVDSFSPSFVVKNNPAKNITQGFISYEMEYHFENIPGAITHSKVNVNNDGISINGTPGSPIPINVKKKFSSSYWLGDNYSNIDFITTSFHFSGGFWDGKNSYGPFIWDKSYTLPVVRE